MARKIPGDRFDALVRGATEIFIARGYRLTQMSDVADAIGVAKGTLYGYVESKDALLLLCLLRADEPASIEVPDMLPLAAPAPGALGAAVRERVSSAAAQPRLQAALERPRAENPESEARDVLGEFFDLLARHRYGIKLLDKCMDHPELGEVWRVVGRRPSGEGFARWIESRVAAGQIRPMHDVQLAARLLIETCTTWAVHIHWDRAPEPYAEADMRRVALDFMTAALQPR